MSVPNPNGLQRSWDYWLYDFELLADVAGWTWIPAIRLWTLDFQLVSLFPIT
ncbi:MAG: hypothetical protein LAO21_22400 [Acidobacteriia bacterium]|nr:hypothetical protein [Terriglobia bacterium]